MLLSCVADINLTCVISYTILTVCKGLILWELSLLLAILYVPIAIFVVFMQLGFGY